MTDIFYSDHHDIDLPEKHRFPMKKYKLLREALQSQSWASCFNFVPTTPIDWKDIALAHGQGYIDKLITKNMNRLEQKTIGFPLGEKLITRSRASVSGFVNACNEAMNSGFSANLSGGTHHAHRNKGEGFCVFNDFAVASLKLLKDKTVRKILILDLDVHQGNGNSSILGTNKNICIVSLHGAKNYPYRKVPSTFDYELLDHTNDHDYIKTLEQALELIEYQNFDLILYQAGVDILKNDSLGRLDLTLEGVKERDKIVFDWAKKRRTPIALGLGGGYTSPLEDTVTAHLNTFELAYKTFYK